MKTIGFSQKAFRDYYTWSLRDKKIFKKINDLILEITHDPFRGTGKPEPLKYEFKGFWSRRITQEHRLVYEVTEKQTSLLAAKGIIPNSGTANPESQGSRLRLGARGAISDETNS